jgi:hypothetical protein
MSVLSEGFGDKASWPIEAPTDHRQLFITRTPLAHCYRHGKQDVANIGIKSGTTALIYESLARMSEGFSTRCISERMLVYTANSSLPARHPQRTGRLLC